MPFHFPMLFSTQSFCILSDLNLVITRISGMRCVNAKPSLWVIFKFKSTVMLNSLVYLKLGFKLIIWFDIIKVVEYYIIFINLFWLFCRMSNYCGNIAWHKSDSIIRVDIITINCLNIHLKSDYWHMHNNFDSSYRSLSIKTNWMSDRVCQYNNTWAIKTSEVDFFPRLYIVIN